jgi:hypothetical protein
MTFRHFFDVTAGGPNLLSDHCAYFQSYEGGQCTFSATGRPASLSQVRRRCRLARPVPALLAVL